MPSVTGKVYNHSKRMRRSAPCWMALQPNCGGSSVSPQKPDCVSSPDRRQPRNYGCEQPGSAKLAGLFLLKHRATRHLATDAFSGRAGNWARDLRKRMGGWRRSNGARREPNGEQPVRPLWERSPAPSPLPAGAASSLSYLTKAATISTSSATSFSFGLSEAVSCFQEAAGATPVCGLHGSIAAVASRASGQAPRHLCQPLCRQGTIPTRRSLIDRCR